MRKLHSLRLPKPQQRGRSFEETCLPFVECERLVVVDGPLEQHTKGSQIGLGFVASLFSSEAVILALHSHHGFLSFRKHLSLERIDHDSGISSRRWNGDLTRKRWLRPQRNFVVCRHAAMGAVDIRGIVRLVKVKRERLVRLKVKREHRPASKASDAATEDIRGIVQTRSCRPLPQIMLHPSRAGTACSRAPPPSTRTSRAGTQQE